VVKDERARQRRALARKFLQLRTKLDRAERINARLHQRGVCVNRATSDASHEVKHLI